MLDLIGELNRRNTVLARTGWLHICLFFAALALSLVDETQVMGVNVWIKPMKFMVSIAIYLWTIAWFMAYLPGPLAALRLVAWGASSAMILESVCLWVQAARGTQSHFNTGTEFDAAVFGTMGVLIMINSLLGALVLGLFFQPGIRLPRAYLWSIRIGLGVFLLGSLEGMVMIANEGHAVGVPDGGPGLLFLNWSIEGGDLRIAHMLGLHALQVIPLFGYFVSFRVSTDSDLLKMVLLFAFSLSYVLLFGLGFWLAYRGQPAILPFLTGLIGQ